MRTALASAESNARSEAVLKPDAEADVDADAEDEDEDVGLWPPAPLARLGVALALGVLIESIRMGTQVLGKAAPTPS